MRWMIAVACVGLMVACADTEPPTAERDGGGQIPASPSPTTTPTPSPADGTREDGLPAGWTLCTNEVRGYAIGYPEDWHTASTGPRYVCRWFDPDRFEVERGTEAPLTALTVNPTQRPFEEAREGLRASESHRLESAETVTVAGREAVRFERVQTRDLLFPEGTRTYGYLFDHADEALYVQTSEVPGADVDYERNKEVVDRAAATLQFTSGA